MTWRDAELSWVFPTFSSCERLARPSQQSAHACGQFRHCERFDQIIVSSGIKAHHTTFDRVACREDQNGYFVSFASQIAQYVETVSIGQAEVQHDRIVMQRRKSANTFLRGREGVEIEALAAKAFNKRLR